MGRLTEERQRAKDDRKVFVDLTLDFSYLDKEWKEKGLFGRIQTRGPFNPEQNDDLMRAYFLIAYGTPLDDPSHKRRAKKKKKKRRRARPVRTKRRSRT